MWSVVRLRSRRSARRMKKTYSERQRKLERRFGSRSPNNKILRSLYWALRGCQYWLCFYDDEIEIDVEDLKSNPFNAQPPSLESLQQRTGFQKTWLMFMYRNFKQKCSNGRMTKIEWRSIFRLLFPYAVNYQFADRLYTAITSTRGHPHITFEDLIICLWELTEGAIRSERNQQQQADISHLASFVFAILEPDAKGRVDETGFRDYVQSIFNLCSSTKEDATFTLGLPTFYHHRRMTANEIRPISPTIRKLALERFRSLDTDHDGFITVTDIEREMSTGRGYALMSMRDVEEAANRKLSG